MTVLIRSAQLFNDYFGKTNCDNSVWWALVHGWLAARTFANHQLLAHSVKLVLERTNYEVGSMGVGTGLYLYVVVVKSSPWLSHLLMSSCINMVVGLESSYGGNGVLKMSALMLANVLVSSRNLACRYRRRQDTTFPSTDFWYLSPKIFGPSEFFVTITTNGTENFKRSEVRGSTDPAEIWSTCGPD